MPTPPRTPPASQRGKTLAIAPEIPVKTPIMVRPIRPPKIATTPLHDIRLKCLECSGGTQLEVKECQLAWCDLFPWRFGRRPLVEGRKKRVLSDEQKAALAAGRVEKAATEAAP